MKESGELPAISREVREILKELEKQEESGSRIYERLCHWSGKLFGKITKDMDMTEETRKKIAWADLKVTPTEWWAGFLLIVIFPILATILPWAVLTISGATLISYWYLPVLGLGLSGLLGFSFYYYPISAANIAKTEAQSKAIETIMLLSFALHHKSDLRGSAIFAGNASNGKLSEDLRQGLLELDQKRSYESVRQMFVAIAHKWRNVDEGVRRAIFDILRSTGQSDESIRQQDVSQAPKRVLESSEKQLDSKLNSVVMPMMTFMVLGSIAIVGVIGLSPIYGMIGMNFIDIEFFALTAVALIAGFFVFTLVIERRRPVTLPSPRISEKDERVPPEGAVRIFGQELSTWIPTFLVFLVIASPGIIYLSGAFHSNYIISGPNTFWFVWAGSASLAVYAYLRVGPRAEIKREVRQATEDWTMALNTIGSRILDGRPMKQAMEETSEIMPETKVGATLQEATTTMERISVDPNYAIFKTGIAQRIYNPLITSYLGIITKIKRGSEEAAGRASMMAAEFLDTLVEVERRFKGKVSDAIGNLWLMAVVLLPVVSALSVWVMDFTREMSSSVSSTAGKAGLANIPLLVSSMETAEIATLKLIMGFMVLALILIVIRHISVIRAGRDPVEFWKSVPLATITGTALFTLAYLGFGLLNLVGT